MRGSRPGPVLLEVRLRRHAGTYGVKWVILGSAECEGIRRMEMRSYTRSTVFLSVFAAAVLTGATVMAAPITLPVGPLFIQYTNDEQFSLSNQIHSTVPGQPQTQTSEGNWGILQISSIV